ncbi:hypothetical protein [Actinacidiphila oryziradicis]|uniref:Exo-alpha-sialidase n=1 Tax=Actinacidiphila oryziradicis TaxID=2571141 RepID=A0A4U0RZ11_9ACTN|nr:hypothetical protein [Actinacidiphila oryziradicis]TKA00978.1 hypothetical protein FCI23_41375 [Actinacidiphila oryziradicis]
MPDPVVPRRAFVAVSAIGVVRMAVGDNAGTVPVPPLVPTNVQVTSDQFSAHIEPSLAVNPRRRDNLIAACRVFEGPLIGIAAYASFDGGGTWSGTGLLPGLVADSDGNASVAFDARGRGFVCGVVANGATRRGDAHLWGTGDGGQSFQPPVIAIPGGFGLTDHPSLAIDQGPASSPPRLYVAARLYGTADDGLVFVRGTAQVMRFVTEHARSQPHRTARVVGALRSLLRFLHVVGITATGLAAGLPSVAAWKLSGLPKALPGDQVAAAGAAKASRRPGHRHGHPGAVVSLLLAGGLLRLLLAVPAGLAGARLDRGGVPPFRIRLAVQRVQARTADEHVGLLSSDRQGTEYALTYCGGERAHVTATVGSFGRC